LAIRRHRQRVRRVCRLRRRAPGRPREALLHDQRVRVVRRRRISGPHRPSRRRQGSAPRRSTWSQLVGLRAETSPPSCGPRPRVGRPSDPRTGPAGTKVGFAENIRVAVPLMDTPEYVAAAEKATRERNAGYMTVMLEGRYTDEYLAEAGNDSPRFTDEELRTISSPVDFLRINVYKPGWYVEPSDQPPGYHDIPVNASHPKMFSSWHVFDPEVLYWAPRQMQSIWGATSIYITENGCGASDQVADDGRVYDSDRVMFL